MHPRKIAARLASLLTVLFLAGAGYGAWAGDITVYYFHGTQRCHTCRAIEAEAQQVVETRFKKELDSGALHWKVVNTDEPENEHFVKDFGLVSSSLVVVEENEGKVARFDVLQDVWKLIRDVPRFDQYVTRAIHRYLL